MQNTFLVGGIKNRVKNTDKSTLNAGLPCRKLERDDVLHIKSSPQNKPSFFPRACALGMACQPLLMKQVNPLKARVGETMTCKDPEHWYLRRPIKFSSVPALHESFSQDRSVEIFVFLPSKCKSNKIPERITEHLHSVPASNSLRQVPSALKAAS